MQGQEIDRNRIGMHMQNREFKNIEFLPIWVFGSQHLEDHMMQRSMVRLSQTTRKCTVIMLLCYYLLVLCLMNRNMKRRRSGNQNSYGFFFQGDTKGTNPTVFLCSIPLHQIHEKQYHRKLSNSDVFHSLFLSRTGDSSRQA